MNFHLGCAVWAYKGWVGELYPPGTRTTDFLHLYSRRFTTVEGNTTFYAVPNQETVTRWALETPPGFEFCLKMPRDITHQQSLRSHIPQALKFLEVMRPLGERLGPIFAQLPPIYSPALTDDLTAFLEAWPHSDAPLALEVRHRDWFQEPHASNLTALLASLGVGRVLLDSRPIYSGDDDPQIASERRKPQLPVQFSVTAPFTLIRFISHPHLPVNQPFMEEWVTQIQQWLKAGIRIYFFVHCPTEERSPGNARHFQQLLEQSGVPVPPLPWNHLNQPPNQLSLW
ncbi:hypothetical protein B6N60_04061 [Richelia sinica FACHB-800]|uniref:DUF72 domain-containing protein n=1 Tax=Richelia sinica FACHB-800 TaxID=1357546 RepID=A0A975Y6J7_9NOST|nr:DUF72 domain-containing protein [Richelia sinica]MBD2664795.1 DUF72 domain-containing protein [Richelia sinica FACHB-800]QXE25347.1 hypothetical protein B6N60_04061 [Richelia sinica FACHB-800]